MKILLLGSGGREHALAWKLEQSLSCKRLYIAPGNAGTALHGENVTLDILDFEEVEYFCKVAKIDLIIVGPEQPLVEGIVDHFKGKKGFSNLKIIGPSKEGAQLEGSKAFAKAFMKRIISLQRHTKPSRRKIFRQPKHFSNPWMHHMCSKPMAWRPERE